MMLLGELQTVTGCNQCYCSGSVGICRQRIIKNLRDVSLMKFVYMHVVLLTAGCCCCMLQVLHVCAGSGLQQVLLIQVSLVSLQTWYLVLLFSRKNWDHVFCNRPVKFGKNPADTPHTPRLEGKALEGVFPRKFENLCEMTCNLTQFLVF